MAIPLIVIALYYLFGWRAAVLAFPVLLLSSAVRRQSREPPTGAPTSLRRFARAASFTGLVAIPVAAVSLGNAEVMRLWAYAAAIVIVLGMARDGKAAKALTTGRLAISETRAKLAHFAIWAAIAGLFVVGSEAIWLKLSMGLWIWYHAFSVPIAMLIMTVVYIVLEWIVGPRRKEASVTAEPPPRAPDDASQSAMVFSRMRSTGSMSHYGSVGVSQAQRISADIDRAEEYRLGEGSMPDGTELHESVFTIVFKDASVLSIFPDGETTMRVRWQFMDPPRGIRLMGTPYGYQAAQVPVSLAPELIDLAWADDWHGIMTRLQPYAPAGLVAAE